MAIASFRKAIFDRDVLPKEQISHDLEMNIVSRS